MGNVSVLYNHATIQKRITELAYQIASDYHEKELVIFIVLQGSFMFASDLLQELFKQGVVDVTIQFIGVSSYGQDVVSSRDPKLTFSSNVSCTGKHVLLVEDIVDTGITVAFLKKHFVQYSPASLAICTLLSKKARREVSVTVDYVGFEIADKWVEGYGLDTNGKGRGNPDIISRN